MPTEAKYKARILLADALAGALDLGSDQCVGEGDLDHLSGDEPHLTSPRRPATTASASTPSPPAMLSRLRDPGRTSGGKRVPRPTGSKCRHSRTAAIRTCLALSGASPGGSPTQTCRSGGRLLFGESVDLFRSSCDAILVIDYFAAASRRKGWRRDAYAEGMVVAVTGGQRRDQRSRVAAAAIEGGRRAGTQSPGLPKQHPRIPSGGYPVVTDSCTGGLFSGNGDAVEAIERAHRCGGDRVGGSCGPPACSNGSEADLSLCARSKLTRGAGTNHAPRSWQTGLCVSVICPVRRWRSLGCQRYAASSDALNASEYPVCVVCVRRV